MLGCPVGFRNTIQKWSTRNLEAVCAVGYGDLARTIRRVFSYQQAMDHCFAAELFWRALPNRLAWLSGASQQEKCLKKATSSGAILIGAEDCFENSWKNLNVSKFFESSRDSNGFHGSCLFDERTRTITGFFLSWNPFTNLLLSIKRCVQSSTLLVLI